MSSDPAATAARHSFGGDFDYDTLGGGYAQVRRPDPKISAMVHDVLGSAHTILNVGAGAGSYEREDRHMIAIEPSATMRSQRPRNLAPAIHGYAESLPLDDQSVDASMAMVTIHQWSDWQKGLAELKRVTRGPIVILTFDGDALDKFWLAQYIPELMTAERKRYPAIDAIVAGLRGTTTVHTVPIPIDCTDGFTEAFYGRPERFLDTATRRAQSAWGFIEDGVEDRFVAKFTKELESGAWDEKHGHLRNQPTFDGSLRLIVSTP